MWQRKHIEELIDDLTSEFLDYYKPGDTRPTVADYGTYFMGSIILAGRENAIIDGQQRLSSLTLLLMYLNNRLKAAGQSYNMIETMIFLNPLARSHLISMSMTARNVWKLFLIMWILTLPGAGESVCNLYGRYQDIQGGFP